MSSGQYIVRIRTTVDAPERRGDSYPKVSPGHHCNWTMTFDKQRGAVALYRDVLAGEYDFGSEFVSLVVVLQMREQRSPRLVRRYRRRERPTPDAPVAEIPV